MRRQGEVRYCDKPLKGAGGLLSAFLLEAVLGQAASEPCSKAVVNSASLRSQVTAGITGLCNDLPRLAAGLGVVPGAEDSARGSLLPPGLSLAENG